MLRVRKQEREKKGGGRYSFFGVGRVTSTRNGRWGIYVVRKRNRRARFERGEKGIKGLLRGEAEFEVNKRSFAEKGFARQAEEEKEWC